MDHSCFIWSTIVASWHVAHENILWKTLESWCFDKLLHISVFAATFAARKGVRPFIISYCMECYLKKMLRRYSILFTISYFKEYVIWEYHLYFNGFYLFMKGCPSSSISVLITCIYWYVKNEVILLILSWIELLCDLLIYKFYLCHYFMSIFWNIMSWLPTPEILIFVICIFIDIRCVLIWFIYTSVCMQISKWWTLCIRYTLWLSQDR